MWGYCTMLPPGDRVWNAATGAWKRLGLSSWSRLALFIALEKTISWYFFWTFFPWYLNHRGMVRGACEIWVFLVAVSAVFLFTYDCLDIDAVGLEDIKKRLYGKGQRFKEFFLWRVIPLPAVEFLVVYNQFFPGFARLFLRTRGEPAAFRFEAVSLLLGTTYNVAWWTAYSVVILGVVHRIF